MAKANINFLNGWADVLKQLEAFLGDDSQDFGKKASVGLDLLDVVLASLANQSLISVLDIQIKGHTDTSTKEIKYSLESEYIEDEDAEDYEVYNVVKTENEVTEL